MPFTYSLRRLRFCWTPCECPEESPSELVKYADEVFRQGKGAHGTKYEYGFPYFGMLPNGKYDVLKEGQAGEPGHAGGKYDNVTYYRGQPLYRDKYREINCYWLVRNTLDENMYRYEDIFLCPITDEADAKRGDIIFYRWQETVNGKKYRGYHCAFVAQGIKEHKDGKLETFDAGGPISDIDYFTWDYQTLKGSKAWYDIKFYRPNKGCYRKLCVGGSPVGPGVELEGAPPRDPLLMDTDGNGIQTVGHDAEIVFDHDANGFKELTGWVAEGDGVLMRDRNGNHRLDDGRELFGNFTIQPDGTRASNGFEALAYYDVNHDGRINSEDPIWPELRVWQSDRAWGDVHQPETDPGAWTRTLEELGISSIYLDSVVVDSTDEAGNTQLRAGGFEWTDGRTGTIAEYDLLRDTGATIPVEYVEISSEIADMPGLTGRGNMYDFRHEMVRDSSGEFKAKVEAFAAETDIGARESIFEEILFSGPGLISLRQMPSAALMGAGHLSCGRFSVCLPKTRAPLAVP
ncbi:hypothetical protein ACFL2Q_06840 [Thermodesulfobacteriota bacterium]